MYQKKMRALKYYPPRRLSPPPPPPPSEFDSRMHDGDESWENCAHYNGRFAAMQ